MKLAIQSRHCQALANLPRHQYFFINSGRGEPVLPLILHHPWMLSDTTRRRQLCNTCWPAKVSSRYDGDEVSGMTAVNDGVVNERSWELCAPLCTDPTKGLCLSSLVARLRCAVLPTVLSRLNVLLQIPRACCWAALMHPLHCTEQLPSPHRNDLVVHATA